MNSMKTSVNKDEFLEMLRQQEERIDHMYNSSYGYDEYNKNVIENMKKAIMLIEFTDNIRISKN
jgi:hypothetical protein